MKCHLRTQPGQRVGVPFSMTPEWKCVHGSVVGTSHVDDDLPCQDCCDVRVVDLDGEIALVACVADGAGSASHSDIGSTTACRTFQALVADHGWRLSELGADEFAQAFEGVVVTWCRQMRSAIETEATELGTPVRQLACTFLGAIIFGNHAGFIQIGDGAITLRKGEVSGVVFWPQSGEYANTTNFLTDDDFQRNLECQVTFGRVEELAMFSDGLERMILRFAEHTVHQPFLLPLYEQLREVLDSSELTEPLQTFLGSDQVNARTDDDKSLILASRMN